MFDDVAASDVKQILYDFEMFYYDVPLRRFAVLIYRPNVKQLLRRNIVMQNVVAEQRLCRFVCDIDTCHATWHGG